MSAEPARTVLLRERVPRECRLSRADVDLLLADHRPHVEVVPTHRRGRYRLTPTGHVGTIVLPTRRFVIRPKVPLANLFHLLDPTSPSPVIDDRAETVIGTEALDYLAGRLAQLLAERAAVGLHRGNAERGTFLQGRLDVAAQVRGGGARKDALHCRFEEFTIDVPCSRVPKAVADLVLRSPLASERARSAVRQSLSGFDDVQVASLGPDSFAEFARRQGLTYSCTMRALRRLLGRILPMYHTLPRSSLLLSAGPVVLLVALLVCARPVHGQQTPSKESSVQIAARQFEKELKEVEDYDPSLKNLVRLYQSWVGLVIIAVVVVSVMIAFKVTIWFFCRMSATTDPEKVALSDPRVRAHLAGQKTEGDAPQTSGQ